MSALSRSARLSLGALVVALATALTGMAAGITVTSAGAATPEPAASASSEARAVSITITDNKTSARAGDKLDYVTTVTNHGATDIQLLLEITVPDSTLVRDAGGGTIRQNKIDYGVTVLAQGHVTQGFTLTVAPIAAGQKSLAAVASVYVLGAPSASAVAGPDVAATDSNEISAAAGVAASASPAAAGATAADDTTASSTIPGPRGLWIAALVLGALLIGVGLIMALRRSAGPGRPHAAAGRRRASQPRGFRPPLPGGGSAVTPGAPVSLSHPGRAARRAAQAAADAGIRTGAHQANRSLR